MFRGQVPWYIDINVYSLEARVVLELGGIFAGMETHESWIDAISIPLYSSTLLIPRFSR